MNRNQTRFRNIVRRTVTALLAASMVLGIARGQIPTAAEEEVSTPICTMAEHIHTDACRAVTCGKVERILHYHSDSCRDSEGNLICGLPETDFHVHSDSCFRAIVCGLPETEGHTHGEECRQEDVTVCTIPETPAHHHSEACWGISPEPVCGQTAPELHTHDSACYSLVCGMEEHSHSADCFPAAEPDPSAAETESGEESDPPTAPEETSSLTEPAAPESSPTDSTEGEGDPSETCGEETIQQDGDVAAIEEEPKETVPDNECRMYAVDPLTLQEYEEVFTSDHPEGLLRWVVRVYAQSDVLEITDELPPHLIPGSIQLRMTSGDRTETCTLTVDEEGRLSGENALGTVTGLCEMEDNDDFYTVTIRISAGTEQNPEESVTYELTLDGTVDEEIFTAGMGTFSNSARILIEAGEPGACRQTQEWMIAEASEEPLLVLFALGTPEAIAEPEAEAAAVPAALAANTVGSITVSFPVEGTVYHLYRVGDMVNGKPVPDAAFQDVDMTKPAAAAEEIADRIRKNGTPAETASAKVNNGSAAFSNLPSAMYLLTGDTIVEGGINYHPTPVLVNIPEQNADGSENWDVTLVGDKVMDMDILVTKKWVGDSILYRPTKIVVHLMLNGQPSGAPVTLNYTNNWSYRWTGLPVADWKVTEDVNPKYLCTIQQNLNSFVITNTWKNLPQTGQLWWPVSVMSGAGIVLIALGLILRRKRDRNA